MDVKLSYSKIHQGFGTLVYHFQPSSGNRELIKAVACKAQISKPHQEL